MVKNVKWARRLALKETLRRIEVRTLQGYPSALIHCNGYVWIQLERRGFTVTSAAQPEYMEVSW